MSAKHSKLAGDKPKLEIADIFERYFYDFAKTHKIHPSHLKVINCLKACRTKTLGGHIDKCQSCHFEKISYNSCSNRHCPKCQFLATQRWLDNKQGDLLPINYFHSVFTLPHELNPIILTNKKICFDILFKAVNQTLNGFAKNPKWKLNGQLGWIGVLHTWNQKLLDHFHLHCLIPAGALSFDKKKFNLAKNNFLFPVKPLAKVFKTKFLTLLKQAFHNNQLIFPQKTKPLASPKYFQKLLDSLFDKNKKWSVYVKQPFAGPEQVLKYLGRYTHRIAISNYRIQNIDNHQITFSYRDRTDHNKKKSLTLNSNEFIRRFLLHVLPKNFAKIRSFGFLANRNKNNNLKLIRKLIGKKSQTNSSKEKTKTKTKKSFQEIVLNKTGFDLSICPNCKKGKLSFFKDINKTPIDYDSS